VKMKLWQLQKHRVLLLLLLIALCQESHGKSVLESLDTVSSILHDVVKLAEYVQTAVNAFDGDHNTTAVSWEEESEKKNALMQFKEISRAINETQQQNFQYAMAAKESLEHFIGDNIPLMLQMLDITKTVDAISARYDEMLTYQTRKQKLEADTLVSFAHWVALPNEHSIEHQLKRLHTAVFGQLPFYSHGRDNATTICFLSLMTESYQLSTHKRCSLLLSPQQFVYALYMDIAITELKGYTMLEFSLMTLRLLGKGNFNEEIQLMRHNYAQRTAHAVSSLRAIMQRADRRVWRCDPDKHVHNATYDEVTRLLQGYVENEVDLNNDQSCGQTCPDYSATSSKGCYKQEFCSKQQQCQGDIYDCQFVDSDMRLCQSPTGSSRRYEFIEYENGVLFGRRQSCGRDTNAVESWRRWIFYNCHYCFCLCDEPKHRSDRYFNLRASVSDVEENRVVTGVRFVKHNRVFHLQIQQGQLLPRGVINASTVAWKPVDNYLISQSQVARNVDYHIMDYRNRGLNLDEVTMTDDKAFVVTGVKFRVSNNRLNLQVQFTKFNFEQGLLMQPKNTSVWQVKRYTTSFRQKLNLENLDVPTRATLKSVSSRDNQYLEFVNTGRSQDAAQTTVPFIDIQEVVSAQPLPLAGIGIYHKGSSGYGGFVAPKIINYDFTPHIRVPTQIS
ncbi:hypothetical protein KR093_000909, partial [Drosophila rubida]